LKINTKDEKSGERKESLETLFFPFMEVFKANHLIINFLIYKAVDYKSCCKK